MKFGFNYSVDIPEETLNTFVKHSSDEDGEFYRQIFERMYDSYILENDNDDRLNLVFDDVEDEVIRRVKQIAVEKRLKNRKWFYTDSDDVTTELQVVLFEKPEQTKTDIYKECDLNGLRCKEHTETAIPCYWIGNTCTIECSEPVDKVKIVFGEKE